MAMIRTKKDGLLIFLLVFTLLFLLVLFSTTVKAASMDTAKTISLDKQYRVEVGINYKWYKFKTANYSISAKHHPFYVLDFDMYQCTEDGDEAKCEVVKKDGTIVEYKYDMDGSIESGSNEEMQPNTTYYIRMKSNKSKGNKVVIAIWEASDDPQKNQMRVSMKKKIPYGTYWHNEPNIVVKNQSGKRLVEYVDYMCDFSNCKSIGKAKVTISGWNKYCFASPVTRYFTIVPDRTRIVKKRSWKESGKTRINLKIENVYKKYTYLQISRSTRKSFKVSKTVNVKRAKVKNGTLKLRSSLKRGKKYYYRIRAIKKVGSKKYKGPWSKAVVVKGR